MFSLEVDVYAGRPAATAVHGTDLGCAGTLLWLLLLHLLVRMAVPCVPWNIGLVLTTVGALVSLLFLKKGQKVRVRIRALMINTNYVTDHLIYGLNYNLLPIYIFMQPIMINYAVDQE